MAGRGALLRGERGSARTGADVVVAVAAARVVVVTRVGLTILGRDAVRARAPAHVIVAVAVVLDLAVVGSRITILECQPAIAGARADVVVAAAKLLVVDVMVPSRRVTILG